MDVAIRVEGGSQIGYGHLMRSGALAEELLSREHIVTVATTTPETAQTVFPDNVEIVTLPSRGDPKPFVNWLNKNTPDVVFTDSYPVDTDYQRAIRDQAPLAVLQDDDRHAVCADLFINGNLYGPDLDYEFVGDEPQLCLGTDYVILRREIREKAGDKIPWRDPPERAIITMGGSDTTNQTPTVINAFNGIDINVDVIIGPGFSETQERAARETADVVRSDVRVARNPDNLPSRMFAADLAVATASSTTYELLALGTPIISIPVVKNQERIATALREYDTATVLNREASEVDFSQAIKRYISSATLRRQHRRRGCELVDSRGVKRVTDAVFDVLDA
jgi:UDP-2,4-diacetamido-2,4,6-trideoxy-beta-L-altropyranose hydrolase